MKKFYTILTCLCALASATQAQELQNFHFKMPVLCSAQFELPEVQTQSAQLPAKRLTATIENGSQRVFGHRVVLKLDQASDLLEIKTLLTDERVSTFRALPVKNCYVIETHDALTAAKIADQLSALDSVRYCYPEYELNLKLNRAYAPVPNDQYWKDCWHLDHRDAEGTKLGWDMNARSAWATTRGENVVIAIIDTGIESTHPDLCDNLRSDLHYNLFTDEISCEPLSYNMSFAHGTSVAGLAGAIGNNGIGISGIAPKVGLAGWGIFSPTEKATSLEVSELFLRNNNEIRIHNQSWGEENRMAAVSPLITEALHQSTLPTSEHNGVITVSSAGNCRLYVNLISDLGDANNDALCASGDTIVVAAVDSQGAYASYSSPGACILVAAPGGTSDETLTFLTTDFTGTKGYNYATYDPPFEDYGDYVSGNIVKGTSFSTPIISGVCALVLSANPDLTPRDVRHILIQSAQFTDTTDPDRSTNAAGFPVSHNIGYGVPDAGHAVQLAQNWSNLPTQQEISPATRITNDAAVPLEGYTLQITGDSLDEPLQVPISISNNLFPSETTDFLPLCDLGKVIAPIEEDLTGKAAFVQRGEIAFTDKINYAAAAGASFAVIYDNVDSEQLILMGNTDRCPIPAAFIAKSSATAIQKILETDSSLRAQLVVNPLVYTFDIGDSLICENVFLHVKARSEDCGMLCISLISPSGTRTLLHHYNLGAMTELDWSFNSTHFYYEPTRGTWKVEIVNTPLPEDGSYVQATLESLSLTIQGIPITDTDNDALDDDWELAHFSTLDYTSSNIVSSSGYSNARWQMVGDKIITAATELAVVADVLQSNKIRLAWPGVNGISYEVERHNPEPDQWEQVATVEGTFPQTEYIADIPAEQGMSLFRIQR